MNITLPTFTPTWPAYAMSQRKAFDQVMTRVACHVVDWAMSHKDVQEAFVDHVSCSSPVGRALNDHVDDRMGHAGGLERAIEEGIEEYMHNFEVEANAVKNLDEAVMTIIEDSRELVKNISDVVIEEIANKLSR